MRRRLAAVAVAAASLLALAPAAYGHTVDAAVGDTPFASGNPNAGKNFGTALENGNAENALFRNPTCGAHYGSDGIHPPGNP